MKIFDSSYERDDNFSRRRRSPELDISDNEAARSGDYF